MGGPCAAGSRTTKPAATQRDDIHCSIQKNQCRVKCREIKHVKNAYRIHIVHAYSCKIIGLQSLDRSTSSSSKKLKKQKMMQIFEAKGIQMICSCI